MKKYLLISITVSILLLITSCFKSPINDEEKSLLITEHELIDYGFNFNTDDTLGIYSKTTYFDRSFELEYDIDTVDLDLNGIYLYSMISVETSKRDAGISYSIEKVGFRIGLPDEIETINLDSIFTYGNESKFSLLKNEYGEIGNIFQCRKGKFTYSLIISGLYFNDYENWSDFIIPKLQKIDNFVNN